MIEFIVFAQIVRNLILEKNKYSKKGNKK